MDQPTIQAIVDELEPALAGHFAGRVFQLSPFSLAIDFGARDAGYLFLSADPAQPRMYLIKRRARELEQQSIPLLLFAQAIRSLLSGAKLLSIKKDSEERIVRLEFLSESETGDKSHFTLVAQLTGRSTNLFLLDGDNQVRHALRAPVGAGQEIGQPYRPPETQSSASGTPAESDFNLDATVSSLSEQLDRHFLDREAERSFANRSREVREQLKKEIAQRSKLRKNLQRDLSNHGDPLGHKRMADLLLANISTAKRSGNRVRLIDYYSDGTPELTVELDENTSLQEEAARLFSRYTKAKHAAEQINTRLAQLEPEIENLQNRLAEVEKIIEAGDVAGLTSFEKPAKTSATTRKKQEAEKIPGVRRYRSSDGYEVLVGRAAQTNDRLTFKVAKPHDLWLHAADYPGSHVVIRNLTRNEIPHRTIIEAAQLAAKFSQAGEDSKVTIHYTSRKFLSKPKGAAPGLVRMSTFKTIVVSPAETFPASKLHR
jgi:predicted ribosome quality control (RQC) complex YloA/Tae2 family protein